jgi:hypothetical protein
MPFGGRSQPPHTTHVHPPLGPSRSPPTQTIPRGSLPPLQSWRAAWTRWTWATCCPAGRGGTRCSRGPTRCRGARSSASRWRGCSSTAPSTPYWTSAPARCPQTWAGGAGGDAGAGAARAARTRFGALPGRVSGRVRRSPRPAAVLCRRRVRPTPARPMVPPPQGEMRLYEAATRAGITLLSIGHRPSLKRFHQLVRAAPLERGTRQSRGSVGWARVERWVSRRARQLRSLAKPESADSGALGRKPRARSVHPHARVGARPDSALSHPRPPLSNEQPGRPL